MRVGLIRAKRPTPNALSWILIHSIVFLLGVIIFENQTIKSTITPLFAQALGGGLAATGAAGIFIYWYVKQSESLSRSVAAFASAGLVDIFQARAARIKDEYDIRLNKFKYLDIIGFGLSSFREDYKEDLPLWAEHATIRILLLDPEFPSKSDALALARDKEERSNPGKITADVKQFIEEFKPLVDASGRFRIRLMRCTPGLNIFRVDDEIFFGPYLIGQSSRNSFTFICKRGGFLYTALLQHFEDIWNSDELSKVVN